MTALLIGYAVAITIVFFASRTFSINRPRHTHTSAVKIHCRRALARSGGTPHPPTPARPNTPELGAARRTCVYRKLKHARSDDEARRGSYMT